MEEKRERKVYYLTDHEILTSTSFEMIRPVVFLTCAMHSFTLVAGYFTEQSGSAQYNPQNYVNNVTVT